MKLIKLVSWEIKFITICDVKFSYGGTEKLELDFVYTNLINGSEDEVQIQGVAQVYNLQKGSVGSNFSMQ